MFRTAVAIATCLVTASALAAEEAERPKSESQKIEWLISRVASLEDAVFIRNGDEHSPAEAAKHMRRKWKNAGDKIKTAEAFIERLATRSSLSGKPYKIRFKDGKEVESGPWLRGELEELPDGQV